MFRPDFVKDRDKQNFFLFFKLFYSKNTFNVSILSTTLTLVELSKGNLKG